MKYLKAFKIIYRKRRAGKRISGAQIQQNVRIAIEFLNPKDSGVHWSPVLSPGCPDNCRQLEHFLTPTRNFQHGASDLLHLRFKR